MNWGTGFSACGEGDVGRLRAIGLHAPCFEPVLNCKKSSLQFMRGNVCVCVCQSLESVESVSSAKVAVVVSEEVGMSAVYRR
jgi:hypothetical protein